MAPGPVVPMQTPSSTGVLGKSARHESGSLFVSHRNVTDAVLSLSERLDDRINAITDNAEDVGRAPIDQCFDHDV